MNKKNIYYLLFLLLFIFYFEYSVTILWDSAHYMNYVNILEGTIPVNTWDVVRGPIFPLIIYLGNLFFGKTSQGLTMNTFMYYLLMLFFVYKIIILFFNKFNFSKKKKKILILIIYFLIILNPIIFGFYHSLLTEFVGITLSVISCYFSFVWFDLDILNNKKKFIFLTLFFCFITVFSWFLKQPYVSCGFFPLLVSYIIQLFKKFDIKLFFYRTSTIFCCILSLFVSIKLWNFILVKMGNNPDTDRNPTVSFGYTLINGLGFIKTNSNEEIKNNDYLNSIKLTKKEKNEILNLKKNDKNYIILNIYNDNKIVESDYIEINGDNLSSVSAIVYICKYFLKDPGAILDAYLTNYLSIIDIYSTSSDDGVGFESTKKFDLSFSNEISTIAFKPYYYGSSNIFYMLPEMEERVSCYKQINYTFKLINYLMLLFGKVFLILFKFFFLFLPLNFLMSIILILKKNNVNKNKILSFVIILFGFSFLHLLLHTVTGAIIDRYAVPAFLTTILGTLFLVLYLCEYKFKKYK